MQLLHFEKTIMRVLLAGEHPELEQLRTQYALAQIRERQVTDSGAFVRFILPSSIDDMRCQHANFYLGDVRFQLSGIHSPGEAILWVREGVLSELEYFLYGREWPQEPEIVSVSYFGDEFTPDISEEKLASYRDFEMLDTQIGRSVA